MYYNFVKTAYLIYISHTFLLFTRCMARNSMSSFIKLIKNACKYSSEV